MSGKKRVEEDKENRGMMATLMERVKEKEVACQKAAEEERLEAEAT